MRLRDGIQRMWICFYQSFIHPDMVWPWPPHPDAHDPVDWVFEFGHFDLERWRKNWQNLFDNYDLIHNNRKTIKIEVSKEGEMDHSNAKHEVNG